MSADITETEVGLCGSIYNEAVTEVKDAEVMEMNQDLFLEQGNTADMAVPFLSQVNFCMLFLLCSPPLPAPLPLPNLF